MWPAGPVTFAFYCAVVRSHLECCVQVWSAELRKDTGPEEGHRDGQRAGAPYTPWGWERLLEQAQRAGVVQLGQRPTETLEHPLHWKGTAGRLKRDFSQVVGQGTRTMAINRKILGRNSSLRGLWDTGSGCPETLWMPHSCQHTHVFIHPVPLARYSHPVSFQEDSYLAAEIFFKMLFFSSFKFVKKPRNE